MKWTILLKHPRQIERTVSKLRPSTQVAFRKAVKDLEEEGPVPQGWMVKKLKGKYQECLSMRLDYRHRMIYEVYQGKMMIQIIEVSSREGAY